MRRSCCSGFVAAVVKLLAFVQAFAGVSAALYAAWAADRWARRGGQIDLDHVSDIWFECAVMGAGVAVSLVVILGYVAAEIRSGCCLSSYGLLATFLLLLEATLAGDLIFNKHWKQDLPHDRTGELENLFKFVENNSDICRWVAIGFVSVQALSLICTWTLRAIVRRAEYDSDEDLIVFRRPLLISQTAPAFVTASDDGGSAYSNFWSAQIRQKYGLNQGYMNDATGPSSSVSC